jgi:hypothetical protein
MGSAEHFCRPGSVAIPPEDPLTDRAPDATDGEHGRNERIGLFDSFDREIRWTRELDRSLQ